MAKAYTKTEGVSSLCVKLESREEYEAVREALCDYRQSRRRQVGYTDALTRAATNVLTTIVGAKRKAERAGGAEYTRTTNNF